MKGSSEQADKDDSHSVRESYVFKNWQESNAPTIEPKNPKRNATASYDSKKQFLMPMTTEPVLQRPKRNTNSSPIPEPMNTALESNRRSKVVISPRMRGAVVQVVVIFAIKYKDPILKPWRPIIIIGKLIRRTIKRVANNETWKSQERAKHIKLSVIAF